MLDRDAALFVARAEAERLVTTGISIGTRIDLYCSATGRVLLSGWADERLSAYLDRVKIEARTKYSLVKKTALRDAVRNASTQGYAFDRSGAGDRIAVDRGPRGRFPRRGGQRR